MGSRGFKSPKIQRVYIRIRVLLYFGVIKYQLFRPKSFRITSLHDDVIKWKHFPHYWPFVRGIHRPPVNFRTKASGAELWFFSFIWVWINGWVNNRKAGDLRRYRAHYDVIVMGNEAIRRSSQCKWSDLLKSLVIAWQWFTDLYGNNANLRDLIAASGLVIVLKLD